MRFIDFFSGAGGMRMGLERANHRCVGFCEFDKYARQSYKAIFNTEGEWENHDIRTVNPNEIPKSDLWAYGFPCQDISVAGKGRGIGTHLGDEQAGERSNLFFKVVELLQRMPQENKPRWLLCENVKNLLSIDRGWGFARVLYSLEEAGYHSMWQVFNTRYSYVAGGKIVPGIPQNRERVYIISHLGDLCPGKIFPVRRTDETDINELQELTQGNESQFHRVYDANGSAPTIGGAITKMGRIAIPEDVKRVGSVTDKGGQASWVYDAEGSARTLMGEAGGGGAKTGYYAIPDAKRVAYLKPGSQRYNVYDKDGSAPTLCAGMGEGGNTQPFVFDEPHVVGGIGNPDDFGKQFRQGNRIYSTNAPSPALQANGGNASGGSVLIEEPKIIDAYNKKIKDEIGTLTSESNTSISHCGTFLVADAKIVDALYSNREPRVTDECPTLRADRNGLCVLKKERNEYGKEIRKAYESHDIDEKRANMTQYAPREDGVTNTISTVQKDNYLMECRPVLTPDREEKRQNGRRMKNDGEPMFTLTSQDRHGVALMPVGNKNPSGHGNGGMVYDSNGIAPTIACGDKSYTYVTVEDKNETTVQ